MTTRMTRSPRSRADKIAGSLKLIVSDYVEYDVSGRIATRYTVTPESHSYILRFRSIADVLTYLRSEEAANDAFDAAVEARAKMINVGK